MSDICSSGKLVNRATPKARYRCMTANVCIGLTNATPDSLLTVPQGTSCGIIHALCNHNPVCIAPKVLGMKPLWPRSRRRLSTDCILAKTHHRMETGWHSRRMLESPKQVLVEMPQLCPSFEIFAVPGLPQQGNTEYMEGRTTSTLAHGIKHLSGACFCQLHPFSLVCYR